MNQFDLVRMFSEWNLRSFGGELPILELRFNPRLRISAGRFIPCEGSAIIEIASYLMEESNPEDLIKDTLGHELIHYWLWVKNRPYGHTSEFHQKLMEIGVSRYNTVPRHRPFKHIYSCQSCEQKIFVRKKLKTAACAACCNQYAQGKYHKQFKLKLVASGEGLVPEIDRPKRAG